MTFGLIIGAICAFSVLVRALNKQEKELKEYRRLEKNKYYNDKNYNAY